MNLGEISQMMKLLGQAGKIREGLNEVQVRAARRTVEGEAGGGLVKVTANGAGEILDVRIDAEALKEPESLNPLLVAATNLALRKSKEVLLEESQALMGGLGLPPDMLPPA
jgi:DNA-binding YbaB/EbfC family protein